MMQEVNRARVLHPLASNQREIWFDQMLDSNSPMYNIGGYLDFPFAIDVVRLKQALGLVVRRHDALRIRLHTNEHGAPEQSFEDRVEFEMPVNDFSRASDPLRSAGAWMQKAMERPVDLRSFPLFEVAALKVATDRYLAFYKYHHILLDGWSMAMLSHEQAVIYRQLLEGSLSLSRPPSYTAFLDSERRYRESARYEADRLYWKDVYRCAPEPLFPSLHVDRFESRAASCGKTSLTLPRPFYDRLEHLIPGKNLTAFHVILGALYVNFTRCYQRDDLVVGLPVLNRSGATLKQTAGLCVGVSPAWFRHGRNLSFADLVKAMAVDLKQVYRRQRFPVSEVNHLARLDDSARRQLFDIALSFERHDHDAFFPSLQVKAHALTNNSSPQPLNVYVREFHADEDVKIDFVHNLAFLTVDEAELLKLRIDGVLRAAAEQPDAPIRDLPLLTDADREVLVAGNRTEEPLAGERTIVDVFESTASDFPTNAALCDGDRMLDYAELNDAADGVAQELRELGVERGCLVGVFMPRSVEAIVAMLGIMKTGGIYLPLDPGYPQKRIELMLKDSGAEYVLTLARCQAVLAGYGGRIHCLDSANDPIWKGPARHTGSGPGLRDHAYVIYTSGSTGTPRGVMVEHRGLVNLVLSQIQILDVGPDSRVLPFAPLSFDASLSEVFMALGSGALLQIAPAERLMPDSSLTTLLKKERITHVTLPPSVLAVLPGSELPDLRVLLSAGETCSEEIVGRWAPGRRFFNGYGPTEVSICASMAECEAGAGRPSIGRPLPNTRIFILDCEGQLLPPGVPGEICVAGVGVSPGYLGQPELTASQFVELEGMGRVYRTRDLGRWKADGCLEHLGRVDQQVKVRGFRIEPGEIESALRVHTEIENAVVVAVGDVLRERLVAYVVTDAALERNGLRRFLAQSLPDFMIPSVFVKVDAVPRTPSGKVDRRALPHPDKALRDGAYVAPDDALERQLQRIWQRVMSIERIGMTDSFFAVGGTSLRAAELVNEIEREMDLSIPLGALFKHQTIQDLAAHIRGRAARREDSSLLLPIQTHGDRPPFFCLPGANGGGFYLHALSRELGRAQPFYALQFPGLNGTQIPESFDELAQQHVALIKKTQPQGPYLLGGHSSGGAVAFEIARQLEAAGNTVQLLAIFDTTVAQVEEDDNPYEGFTEEDWVREMLVLFGEDPDSVPGLVIDDEGALIPVEETYVHVREFLARHGMLAGNSSLEQVMALLNVFKTISLAHAAYRPAGPVAAPIRLFIAEELPMRGVRLDQREAGWGWPALTTGGVEVIQVPGNHIDMLNDPRVVSVAQKLVPCLQPAPRLGLDEAASVN